MGFRCLVIFIFALFFVGDSEARYILNGFTSEIICTSAQGEVKSINDFDVERKGVEYVHVRGEDSSSWAAQIKIMSGKYKGYICEISKKYITGFSVKIVNNKVCPPSGITYELEQEISVTPVPVIRGSSKAESRNLFAGSKIRSVGHYSTWACEISLVSDSEQQYTEYFYTSKENLNIGKEIKKYADIEFGPVYKIADGHFLSGNFLTPPDLHKTYIESLTDKIKKNILFMNDSIKILPTDEIVFVSEIGSNYIAKVQNKDDTSRDGLYKVSGVGVQELYREGKIKIFDLLKETIAKVLKNMDELKKEQEICPHEPLEEEMVSMEKIKMEETLVWPICEASKQPHLASRMTLAEENLTRKLKDSQTIIMAQCISESMNSPQRFDYYDPRCKRDYQGILEREDMNEFMTTRKICPSKEISVFMAEKFLNAMKCLGIDPKDMLPIINHESRFQIGAVSASGARSVGMITQGLYYDFRGQISNIKWNLVGRDKCKNQYGDKKTANKKCPRKGINILGKFLEKHMLEQMQGNRSECKELKKFYNSDVPRSIGDNNSNILFCPPANPELNFLLSGMYYLRNIQHAKAVFSNKKYGVPAGKKRDSFVKILAAWTYNAGTGGLDTTLINFRKELYRGNVLVRDDNLKKYSKNKKLKKGLVVGDLSVNQFIKYVGQHVKIYYFGGTRRKKQVAFYTRNIEEDLELVEKNLGVGKCGNSF